MMISISLLELDKEGIDEKSFEWLQTFKYNMEISHDKRKRVVDREGSDKMFYGECCSFLKNHQ